MRVRLAVKIAALCALSIAATAAVMGGHHLLESARIDQQEQTRRGLAIAELIGRRAGGALLARDPDALQAQLPSLEEVGELAWVRLLGGDGAVLATAAQAGAEPPAPAIDTAAAQPGIAVQEEAGGARILDLLVPIETLRLPEEAALPAGSTLPRVAGFVQV